MKYLFKYEPEKKILLFIDQKGHKSGEVMKHYDYIQPHIVERLQEVLAAHPHGTGDHIEIGNVVFLITRKHYASRHDLSAVRSFLKDNTTPYKVSELDFPEIVAVLRESPVLEFYNSLNPKDAPAPILDK